MRQLTLELPADVVDVLIPEAGDNSSRAVLERMAAEGYRSGKLTHAQVRRLLGFEHRLSVDAFLKERGVHRNYTIEEFDRDMETLRKI